ncbi:MAG: YciI-like protein [Ignavibacteriaceae bacterium]
MNYYALFYYVIDDYITQRAKYREEHLKLARAANERGDLIIAGAFNNPPDKALLIFNVDDISIVEDFVRKDPYVINGIVARWEIRDWTVVIGN